MNALSPSLRRSAAAGRLFAMLLAASIGGTMPTSASDMQRMALVPGCHVLPPGAFEDLSAYCLDQSRQPPREGAILSSVSTSLDKAVVKIADRAPLALSAALNAHVVQIEGLGNRRQLRIRNLGDRAVEICIDGPTVVMGNGETYSADLDKIRDRIARLLTPAKSRSNVAGRGDDGPETIAHTVTQQELWDAVNKVHRDESKESAPGIFFGPLPPRDAKKPPSVVPNRANCAGRVDSAELCIE